MLITVLKVYFALIFQPVPMIVTRVTLSFHSVRELSWPCDLTNVPNVFADLWRWCLEGPAYATARAPPRAMRDNLSGPIAISRRSTTRQIFETRHV